VFKRIDELSDNALTKAQNKEAKGWATGDNDMRDEGANEQDALFEQYREPLKAEGMNTDDARAAYRKGKAVEKFADAFDSARVTGPSDVEGAPWELDGKKLRNFVDKSVADGTLKDMGLSDDHINELQSLSKMAEKETNIPKVNSVVKGLGRLAVGVAGLHGGMLPAVEAVTGMSAADYVGKKVSQKVFQDAVMNYDATKAMKEAVKTGNAQPVVDALSKDSSWVDRTKNFVRDTLKRLVKGEAGSAGAPGTVFEPHEIEDLKKLGMSDKDIAEMQSGKHPFADMHAEHLANGGATFDMNGKNMSGTDAWSVGTYPERSENVSDGEFTPERIRQFVQKNKDVLSKPDHAVGSWKDPDSGQNTLDVSKLIQDDVEAKRAGSAANQKAIYHLKRGELADTGGTGEMKTLHHWSNVEGLTETSPEKFGAGKAGAERARSKEPGFKPRTYFADENYREPAIQGQKYHYTTQVNPSKFYDIATDPKGIWQKGFQEGGATAAENAVRDAGYQGYHHEGGYVSFEKHPVKLATSGTTATTMNASGESSASMEAQNRLKSQQAQGLQVYDVDSRMAGSPSAWHPVMASVDRIDQQAQPFHHLVQFDPKTGSFETLSSGENAKPLPPDARMRQLVGQAAGVAPSTSTRPVDMSASEIGTRYPTSVSSAGANDPSMLTGMDALNEADKQSPSRMTQAGKPVLGIKQKLAAALADYKDNGISHTIDAAAAPESSIESYVNHIKENLKWLHNIMPESLRSVSKHWYETAHNVTKDIAQKNGVTHEQAAAVTAALSPKNDWNNNVGQAKRLIEHYNNDQNHAWTDKMDAAVSDIRNSGAINDQFKRMLTDIRGKKLSELTAKSPEALLAKKALWYRILDEAHGAKDTPIYGPDGSVQGSQTFNWGQVDPIAKALSILDDGSVENINSVMGEGHKIRNFYNNIINPWSKRGHTTIDTHAVGAGLLKPLTQDDIEVAHNFGSGNKAGVPSPAKHSATGLKGSYSVYEEAYRRAAKDLGIQPRELQSITWEGIRSLMGDHKKTLELRRAVNEIWRAHEGGHMTLDEAREKILEHSGGFSKPDWMTDEQWEANPNEEGDTSFAGGQ
jgi:hypothetical protein